jgi:hypothetical protein
VFEFHLPEVAGMVPFPPPGHDDADGGTDRRPPESEAVDGQFSGRVALCDPGRIGDTSEPRFGSMTTHFDYCKRDACGALYEHGGRIPAYFEARGDGPYSVGVAFAPGRAKPDE